MTTFIKSWFPCAFFVRWSSPTIEQLLINSVKKYMQKRTIVCEKNYAKIVTNHQNKQFHILHLRYRRRCANFVYLLSWCHNRYYDSHNLIVFRNKDIKSFIERCFSEYVNYLFKYKVFPLDSKKKIIMIRNMWNLISMSLYNVVHRWKCRL